MLSLVLCLSLTLVYLISEQESIFKEDSTKNPLGPTPGGPTPTKNRRIAPSIIQANQAAPAVASHSGSASVVEDVEDMDAGGWDWV